MYSVTLYAVLLIQLARMGVLRVRGELSRTPARRFNSRVWVYCEYGSAVPYSLRSDSTRAYGCTASFFLHLTTLSTDDSTRAYGCTAELTYELDNTVSKSYVMHSNYNVLNPNSTTVFIL